MTASKPTASDAWDHIHRLFGVGDWSPDDEQPWWEFRRDQAMRLKARMTRLNLTPEEVMRCADYCKAEGIDIRNATWVTKHYYEAKKWAEQRENERSRHDVEDRISEAIATEMDHDHDSPWISKLMLAQGSYREEVLDEWQAWNRQRSSSPSPRANPGPRTA
jgi:hypothetical protein